LNNDLVNDLERTESTKFVPADASNLVVGLSVVVEKKVEACKDARFNGTKVTFPAGIC